MLRWTLVAVSILCFFKFSFICSKSELRSTSTSTLTSTSTSQLPHDVPKGIGRKSHSSKGHHAPLMSVSRGNRDDNNNHNGNNHNHNHNHNSTVTVTVLADHLAMIQRASGVYKAGRLNRDLSSFQSLVVNHTVVLTACNFAYLPFFHNFKCFLDRLGINVLVFAMDERSYASLIALNITTILWSNTTEQTNKNRNTNHHNHNMEAAHAFQSKQFNLISNIKMTVVEYVIGLGFHVIFIDPDIAVVRDPVPQLVFQGVDYVHSTNQPCSNNVSSNHWDFHSSLDDGNTGFYFVHSNARTRQLYELFAKESIKWPRLDDQSIFWKKMLRSTESPSSLGLLTIEPQSRCQDVVVPVSSNADNLHLHLNADGNSSHIIRSCHLDVCQYSAGSVRDAAAFEALRYALTETKQPMMTIHANWMLGAGAKESAMKRHGFWIVHNNLPVNDIVYTGRKHEYTCSDFSLDI